MGISKANTASIISWPDLINFILHQWAATLWRHNYGEMFIFMSPGLTFDTLNTAHTADQLCPRKLVSPEGLFEIVMERTEWKIGRFPMI